MLDLGLEYAQIALLLDEAKERGFLAHNAEGVISLTDAGEQYLRSEAKRSPTASSAWIRPYEEYRKPPIELWAPYLPQFPPGG